MKKFFMALLCLCLFEPALLFANDSGPQSQQDEILLAKSTKKKKRKRKKRRRKKRKMKQSGDYKGPMYGMAGCGLGSQVFKRKNSTGKQITAWTLNGTGMQTFGISTGTSNCVQEKGKTAETRRGYAKKFIEDNQEFLANDIAMQSGETLVSLAQIMECKDVMVLGHHLQKNYEHIFEANASEAVSYRLIESIDQHSYLQRTCSI